MSIHAVDGPVRLRLSVPAGRIEIEPRDAGAVEVELTALRNDDVTSSAIAEARVVASERGGRHEIRVEVPRTKGGLLSLGRQPKVGVLVRCPMGSDVDVDTASADVDAACRLWRREREDGFRGCRRRACRSALGHLGQR